MAASPGRGGEALSRGKPATSPPGSGDAGVARGRGLAEFVYSRLKGELYTSLRPGDRLVESAIAGRLAVSRTPVREALQRLVREGYLLAHLRNGYTVAAVDFGVVNELYHVRAVLEVEALRLCCEREGGVALGALETVWCVPRARQVRDTGAVAQLNTEFHAGLVALSGNRELARVHGEVFDRIRLVQRLDFTRDERIDATYEEHAAILAALARRDSERAAALLRAHIGYSRDKVEEIATGQIRRGAPGE